MNFELPGSRISGLTGNLASASSFGIVDQTATECMILPQNRKKLVPQQAESGGKIFSRINSNLAQDLCVGCSFSKSMKQTEHGSRDHRGSNIQEKMHCTQEKHSRVNQEVKLSQTAFLNNVLPPATSNVNVRACFIPIGNEVN
jgi:hypothetical protein